MATSGGNSVMRQANSLKPFARRMGLTRSRAAMLRLRYERAAAAIRVRANRARPPRILAYHAVGTPLWGVNDCTPDMFRKHMQIALAEGYHFVPAHEMARTGGAEGDLAVTFDDGLISVLVNAAPVLRDLGIPWTFFVTTGYADGSSPWSAGTFAGWRDLERVPALGGVIGSHAVSHRNFSTLNADEAREEIYRSREKIDAALGLRPEEFAIPFGRSCDWTPAAQRHAAAAGYATVYSYTERRRFPGTAGRTAVTRFDGERGFRALLAGAFDDWQEWI